MNKQIHKTKSQLSFKKKHLSFFYNLSNNALLQKNMQSWKAHLLWLNVNQEEGFQAYLTFPLSLRFESEMPWSKRDHRKEIIFNDHLYCLNLK